MFAAVMIEKLAPFMELAFAHEELTLPILLMEVGSVSTFTAVMPHLYGRLFLLSHINTVYS